VNCYPFIEAEKAQRRNVKRACELLKVSRSAYYQARGDEPSGRARQDAELAAQVKAVHEESKGRYGAPRVHAQLRAGGRRHSRKRVARLMRQSGLQGRAAKRWKKTTIPDPAAAARADRIRRDFTADASKVNTRWCGDITYIATWEGWLYLATVIDIASRRVVGYAMADHLRTELISDALSNAVAARDPSRAYLPLRPRLPVHLGRLRRPRRGEPGHPVGRQDRAVLGQRPGRELLLLAQGRAHRHQGLAGPGRGQAGGRGVHRLVQRHPAALIPRLPKPSRLRKQPPQQCQASSLT
jgi:Transposase and inactivated derivatives